VIVKPILAFVTLILGFAKVYNEGSFSPASGYLWVTIVDNISITVHGHRTLSMALSLSLSRELTRRR